MKLIDYILCLLLLVILSKKWHVCFGFVDQLSDFQYTRLKLRNK
jgi:hypothetical protein